MPNSNYHAPGECDSLVLDDMNFFSALSFYVRRLITFREQRDRLRIEHANAVREVKVLRKIGMLS